MELDFESQTEKRSSYNSFPDLEEQTVEIRKGNQNIGLNTVYNRQSASPGHVRANHLVGIKFGNI